MQTTKFNYYIHHVIQKPVLIEKTDYYEQILIEHEDKKIFISLIEYDPDKYDISAFKIVENNMKIDLYNKLDYGGRTKDFDEAINLYENTIEQIKTDLKRKMK